MNQFGKKSNDKLNTCHIDLQKIMRLTIKRSAVDFGIAEGQRPKQRQFELFKVGRVLGSDGWKVIGDTITNVDGYMIEGKHNKTPSEAVDVYAYHPNREMRAKIAYDKIHLIYIAATAICCAQELYEKGEITHLLRSGANWDKDGVIYIDQKFDDFPHLEIYKPKN